MILSQNDGRRGIKTWYYTTNLHVGAFMLPKYVEDILEEEEGKRNSTLNRQYGRSDKTEVM